MCELCGCARVRFLHHMRHRLVGHPIAVGCLCDGIMSGDELGAYEREREARKDVYKRQHGTPREKEHGTPKQGELNTPGGGQGSVSYTHLDVYKRQM